MGALSQARMLARLSDTTRILAYIMVTAALVLLILKFLSYVPIISRNAYSIDTLSDLLLNTMFLRDLFGQFFVLLGVAVVLKYLARYFDKLSREKVEEFNKLLVGYIESYGRINLNDLAIRLNEDVTTVEEHIAKLVHQSHIKIRISGGEVTVAEEIPAPVPPIEAEAGTLEEAVQRTGSELAPTTVKEEEETPASETTVVEQGTPAPQTSKASLEDVIKHIENIDIDALEELRNNNIIDQELFNKIMRVYEAYKAGLISKKSFISAAKSMVEDYFERGRGG